MASSIHLSEEMQLLEALPAFELFEREALQIIAFSSDVRSMRAGDVLFRRGEISDSGYLILSGAVAFEADAARGEGSRFDRGALLGSQALFAPTERPATAIVQEEGRVMRISRSIVLRVLETFPGTAEKLRSRMAQDTSETLALFSRVISVLNRDMRMHDRAA
jgi:CRP-like cAMP-binding protein